ncbi:MAG: efflux RND transporter permease subunit, partial [Desulfobacterales bacterium]
EIYSDTDADSDGRVDRFESYIDPDFRTCNVMTRLGQNGDGLLGTAGLKHIEKRISNYLKATLPTEYDFKITGYPLMLIKSVDYIVYGQVQSLLLTLLVIFVVVLILLKDIRAALLSLIPMMVAVIINFGIMGWFGIHLDIATSIIAAITIGIGVDDTIHFLNTFRYYRKQAMSVDAAIEKTLQVSGKAIIFTSLALIFGFSVLELSTFKPLMLFGFLMAVTMVATTIGALLILPCAIKFTGIRLVKQESVPAEKSLKTLIPLLEKKN